MIDKDMVKSSLGLWAGTIHEALELETDIDAALKKHDWVARNGNEEAEDSGVM